MGSFLQMERYFLGTATNHPTRTHLFSAFPRTVALHIFLARNTIYRLSSHSVLTRVTHRDRSGPAARRGLCRREAARQRVSEEAKLQGMKLEAVRNVGGGGE